VVRLGRAVVVTGACRRIPTAAVVRIPPELALSSFAKATAIHGKVPREAGTAGVLFNWRSLIGSFEQIYESISLRSCRES
jgi:hypothetical protein